MVVVKVFSPAIVCVPVVITPLDIAPAFGMFKIKVPNEVIGVVAGSTLTSVPVEPTLRPTLVTVPPAIELAHTALPATLVNTCVGKDVDTPDKLFIATWRFAAATLVPPWL